MRMLTIAAVMLGLGLGPAVAQMGVPGDESKPAGQELNRAECLENFRTADVDGDGVLSVSEAENARQVIPTQLAMPGPITESEFMSACLTNVPKGG